jgi:hypothetical protein
MAEPKHKLDDIADPGLSSVSTCIRKRPFLNAADFVPLPA